MNCPKVPLAFAFVSLIALAGCGSHKSQPDASHPDAAEMDAHAPDAPPAPKPDAEPAEAGEDAGIPDSGVPDMGVVVESGPRGSSFTSAGGRSSSPHFTVYSTTGQATPVSKGEMKSPSYSVAPGILGGK